jgi:hypothetical protein
MKAMFAAATLALLAVASPALAQSDQGMFVRAPASAASASRAEVTGSIGTPRRQVRSLAAPAADTVFDEYGHAIGADPDLNIRMQLYREHDSLEGF